MAFGGCASEPVDTPPPQTVAQPTVAVVGEDLCPRWEPAGELGSLDGDLLDEASGIEASSAYPGRLYHISDGDDSRLYVTSLAGEAHEVVAIRGFVGDDVEDLSLGPCGARTCLFVADIGDNAERRSSVEIVLVEEREEFGGEVTPLDRVRFAYPDGPHDAEALAVHPGGDVFVAARKWSFRSRRVDPVPFFRLAREALESHRGRVLTAEKVGSIDLTALGAGPFPDGAVTAMDISADGRRVLLLNYRGAFELALDLAAVTPQDAPLVPGHDIARVALEVLEQQEAVAWHPDLHGFVYSTELVRRRTLGVDPTGRARIMRQVCEDEELV